mgnify:CR=1 FL=1
MCINKSRPGARVYRVAHSGRGEGVAVLVDEVLETPVSPELVPPEEAGAIKQKTEDILGPYLLHDFFLYYCVGYKLPPANVLAYACAAFDNDFEPWYIREKLILFLRRFCAAQFKRACAPDSASITQVNLNGVNFSIPSDLDPTALLADLDE